MPDELLKYAFHFSSTFIVTGIFLLINRSIKKSDERRQAASKALHEKLDEQGSLMKSMNSRMDCFEKAQHSCQLDNAKEFATKKEVAQVWERVDANTADIAYLKGRGK